MRSTLDAACRRYPVLLNRGGGVGSPWPLLRHLSEIHHNAGCQQGHADKDNGECDPITRTSHPRDMALVIHD